MAIQIWRCSVCGKWSHAKRKPSHHIRVVVDDEASGPCPAWENCCAPNPCAGTSLAVTHEQKCGPFEEWRAEKVHVHPIGDTPPAGMGPDGLPCFHSPPPR